MAFVVDGANRHDSKLLETLLKNCFQQLKPLAFVPNLCLDAGFVGKSQVVAKNGFRPHIRSRGQEKKELKNNSNFRARRWIVEALNSWLKRFRKLCPRYEKTRLSFEALLTLALGLVTINKVMNIYP